MTTREIEWACQKWQEGYSQAEIAKALYTTQQGISYNLKGRVKGRNPTLVRKKDKPPLRYER